MTYERGGRWDDPSERGETEQGNDSNDRAEEERYPEDDSDSGSDYPTGGGTTSNEEDGGGGLGGDRTIDSDY